MGCDVAKERGRMRAFWGGIECVIECGMRKKLGV